MNEFFVIQNYALGALSLYHFTRSYYDTTNKSNGPAFPLTMTVLPIVFNEKCLNSLYEVKKVSGRISMLNVLAEHRDLPVGLQKRMVQMKDQSLKSLNIAFTKGLLNYDKSDQTIVPRKRIVIPPSDVDENQKIFHASRTLGKWFAHNSIEQICIALNITFVTNGI